MLTLDLKGDLGVMLFDNAYPKTDYETGEQRRDFKTGLPQWTVAVLLRQKDSKKAEPINITLNAEKDPAKSFNFGDRIVAKGLVCRTGASQNGGNWVSFTADSIEKR